MHVLSQKPVAPETSTWLGPLFGWEIIREARKGRSYLPRILYAGGLLLLLYFFAGSGTITLSQTSRLGEYLFYAYVTFQYLAVFLLTPLYVAGSLIEEREQGTLVLLLTTDVTPRELILGKMMGRLVPVLGVLLAGVPILAIMQLFGGISIVQLTIHTVAALTLVLVAGMHAIRASTLYTSPGSAIMMTYLGLVGSFFLGYLVAMAATLLLILPLGDVAYLVGLGAFLVMQLFIGRNCLRNAIASLSYRKRGEDRSLAERAKENTRQSVLPTTLVPAHSEDDAEPITVPLRDFAVPEVQALQESLSRKRREMIYSLIPPVFQHCPIVWKQMCFPNRYNLVASSAALAIFATLFLYMTIFENQRDNGAARHAYHGLLRVNMILLLYLSTMFSAISLVLERQQQTFFSLLAAPISVGRIIFEFAWGSVYRYRWLLLMNILLWEGGILMVEPACLVWYPLVFAFQLAFFNILALLLSMLVRTTLQARLLVSLLFLVMVLVLPWATPTSTWLVKVFVMPYSSWETLERLIHIQFWPDWGYLLEVMVGVGSVTGLAGLALYLLIGRYLRRYG